MFIFQGHPLSPDAAFTDINNIQHSAGWLRLVSAKEREAAGVTEVPDPPIYDQRFYWGYDNNSNLIPKDHSQLVQQWVEQTRQTANTLLAPTDWIIIRQLDNGVPADETLRTWRESIRLAAGSKNFEIKATTTTNELAAYIAGSDYPVWPQDPRNLQPTVDPSDPT
jgi:hypothetical protein